MTERVKHRAGAIAGRLVVRIVDFAAARGHDAEALCREHGLVLEQLREPTSRVPYAVVETLGMRVLELTADDYLGLHLAQDVRDAPTFDAGVLLMMSSRTLRDALQRMERYQNYWGDGARYALVASARGMAVRLLQRDPLSVYQRHSEECALAEIVLGARRLTADPQLTPLAVRFRHAALADARELHALFGLMPAFGASHCEIELAHATLDTALPQANEAFRLFFQEQVERALTQLGRSGLAADVRATAHATLASGQCSMTETARTLGISARTLQRRLHAEGTSFGDVVDALRRELAHTYLSQTLSLQEIAWLLGYADVSAFHHAFKRWTGMTPEQARARACISQTT